MADKESSGGIVNKEYHVISATSDGIVDLGQVNKDGIGSGYKVRPHQRVPAPVPHFFQMDRPPLDPQEDITTPRMRQRVGGSIFRGGGTFRIEHGDNVKGGTPNDQDKERKGEMGVYIDAKNGDLVLKSRRRIRIMAEDIDIIATGKDDKKAPTGTINISADEKIRLAAPEIFTDSKVITKIFSSGKVEVIGKMVANIYGQALELTDGRACKRGSTGDINKQLRSEWQEQMIKEGVLECDDAPGYTKGLGSSYI